MRRYDLDWLRVILFGLLVLHHTAVGFAPFGADIYGFANDTLGGELVSLGIYFSHSWRLPSLFLISGIGTYFATRRGAGARFMGARVARLMVPALFGTFVLNVAAGYAIARMTGDARGLLSDPASWWLSPEPSQVMHLWFLYNLTFYTIVCWPLFLFRGRIEALPVPAPWLIAAIVTVVTLIAVAAKPHGAAIAGDGYQLPWYLGFFAGGYLIGAHHASVLDWARRRAYWLLGAGLLTFATEVTLLVAALDRSEPLGEALAAGGWAAAGLAPAYGLTEVLFAAVEGVNAWLWCLTAIGLAARYLNRPGPLLSRLSRATFPIYVLHFPIIIVGLALLAQVPLPWQIEFLILATATYLLSWVLYRLFARAGPCVYLVGGRPEQERRARFA